MTKKNKSRRIVVPFLVLIIAICLILIATNFTQVKGFMASITNSSFDFLARAWQPSDKVNGLSVKITNPIKDQIVLTGSTLNVTWTYSAARTVTQEQKDGETLNVQMVPKGGVVSEFFKGLGSAIHPIVGKVPVVCKVANNISAASNKGNLKNYAREDCQTNFGGETSTNWLIPKLSDLVGKVDASVLGRISKGYYVNPVLTHNAGDPKNLEKTVTDNGTVKVNFTVANTLKIIPSVNNGTPITISAANVIVKPGDKLDIVLDKQGDFSDFGDTKLSVLSSTKSSYVKEIPLNANGTSATWEVLPYYAVEGLPPGISRTFIDANGKRMISKTFLIKAEIVYEGQDDGVAYAENKKPKLIATRLITAVEPMPAVTFTANPTSVSAGAPVTLSWKSESVYSCNDIPENSFLSSEQLKDRTVLRSGSVVVKPLKTTTYLLRCLGDDNKHFDTKPVTVVVQPTTVPKVTLTANKTAVSFGEPVTLTWIGSGVKSCNAEWLSPQLKAVSPIRGIMVVNPIVDTTYIMACIGVDGSSLNSAPIEVKVGDPVISCVTPSITNNTISYFSAGANVPPGKYEVRYKRGTMQDLHKDNHCGDIAEKFLTATGKAPNILGAQYVINYGISKIGAPVGGVTYSDEPQISAGVPVVFNHTAGKIGVNLIDSPYTDNVAGTPNPEYCLYRSTSIITDPDVSNLARPAAIIDSVPPSTGANISCGEGIIRSDGTLTRANGQSMDIACRINRVELINTNYSLVFQYPPRYWLTNYISSDRGYIINALGSTLTISTSRRISPPFGSIGGGYSSWILRPR